MTPREGLDLRLEELAGIKDDVVTLDTEHTSITRTRERFIAKEAMSEKELAEFGRIELLFRTIPDRLLEKRRALQAFGSVLIAEAGHARHCYIKLLRSELDSIHERIRKVCEPFGLSKNALRQIEDLHLDRVRALRKMIAGLGSTISNGGDGEKYARSIAGMCQRAEELLSSK